MSLPYYTVSNLNLVAIAELLSTKAYPIDIKQAQALRLDCKEIQAKPCWGRFPKGMVGLLEVWDTILHTCGIESASIRLKDGTKDAFTYCNTGDPYNVTLFFWKGKFRIGCWGDLVEAYDTEGDN